MMGGRTEAEGDVRRSACGPCSSASTPSGRKEKEEEILSAEETKGKRRVLPPSREEIGRCSWKVLHSMAARYPENPVRLFSRLFLHHHHFASSFLPSLSRVSRQLSSEGRKRCRVSRERKRTGHTRCTYRSSNSSGVRLPLPSLLSYDSIPQAWFPLLSNALLLFSNATFLWLVIISSNAFLMKSRVRRV